MITVFTPTFNRGNLLPRLYKSLREQTYHNFEWIIVDDGSTDDTEKICQRYLNERQFTVTYVSQNNSGKHVAINRGANIAHGEWFFIVDSDDYLPPDSIALNEHYLDQISEDTSFAGVSGLCLDHEGQMLLFPGMTSDNLTTMIRKNLTREYIDATPQDYREKYKMPGDRAEIIRTDLIRRFPFPSFPGETFVSEFYLWQSISDAGLRLRWFNKPTYIAQYQPDGLTRTMKSVMRSNPLGRSFCDNYAMRSTAPVRTKLRAAINYTRYGRFGGKTVRQLQKEVSRKDLFLLGLCPALLFPIKEDNK